VRVKGSPGHNKKKAREKEGTEINEKTLRYDNAFWWKCHCIITTAVVESTAVLTVHLGLNKFKA
jgi:hypothetical protein